MQPGRGHAEGTDPEVTTNNKRQENVMPANRTPVVFIHGMWLHASSWAPWLELFRTAGYDPIAPGWPGEPDTVTEARESPELVANTSIDDATAHYTKIIDSLDAPPTECPMRIGGASRESMIFV